MYRSLAISCVMGLCLSLYAITSTGAATIPQRSGFMSRPLSAEEMKDTGGRGYSCDKTICQVPDGTYPCIPWYVGGTWQYSYTNSYNPGLTCRQNNQDPNSTCVQFSKWCSWTQYYQTTNCTDIPYTSTHTMNNFCSGGNATHPTP